jgi:hypothetical protein
MVAAFEVARCSLSSTAVLEHPVPKADLSLVTDASATHVGAVIQQQRPGQGWRLLGFFSAQLDKAQVNYSAFDRELFAVVAEIKHFRYMLEGRSFTVFTDHRPQAGALSRRSDPWLSRQQRHLSFIAEFLPTIRHIAGQYNVMADTLSRPSGAAAPVAQSEKQHPPPAGGVRGAAKCRVEVNVPCGSSAPFFAQVSSVAASSPSPASLVDLAALAAAQSSCPDCRQAPSSFALSVTTIQMDNTSIMVDTSSGVFRPFVLAAFRRPIFDTIHGLAHPGIRATRRLIASCFVRPGLASQVAAWCRNYQHCQRAKVTAQPSSPPLDIANPVQRFSHLHIDLVGPFLNLPTATLTS